MKNIRLPFNMRLPEIMVLGRIFIDRNYSKKFHSETFHELLHVISGSMSLDFEDGRHYLGGKGDTLFIPGGTSHRDTSLNDGDVDILYIRFKWSRGEEFFQQISPGQLKNAPEDIRSEIRTIFDMLLIDQRHDKLLRNIRLAHILALAYCAAGAEEPEDAVKQVNPRSRRSMVLQEAKRFIAGHYREPLRLEDLAAHLKVSPSYISRVFSEDGEFSFFEYVTQARIREAKKLLLEGTWTINDLALYLGYDNGSYFSKIFRKHVGVSPGKYRTEP